MASHRGWENRSRPDFLSPSFQPAVNASQQESNNVVFPPWEGELQTSISTYLKCKSLSQSAVSLPLAQVWRGHGDAVGSRILARSFAVVSGWLWGAWEGCIPLGLSDSKCTWPTRVGWGFANLGGFPLVACAAFGSHPTLRPSIPLAKGTHSPLSICVAAAVFCFLMISKAFLSPSFSWGKSERRGQK